MATASVSSYEYIQPKKVSEFRQGRHRVQEQNALTILSNSIQGVQRDCDKGKPGEDAS